MSCGSNSSKFPSIRYCALCLIRISGAEIHKCGKCRKRIYCSKECQTADWSSKKNGQGHKNWCGVDYGEEDIDWIRYPLPGWKGIQALRDIPAGYPIIVEGGLDENHSRAIESKHRQLRSEVRHEQLGRLQSGDQIDVTKLPVPLPISRLTHSCTPNADLFYDRSVKATVLFALRDIKEREMISIAYVAFDDLSRTETPEMTRKDLREKWDIFCYEDCFCHDEAYYEKVKKGREVDKAAFILWTAGEKVEGLAAAEKCLKMENELKLSVINVKRTIEKGLEITMKEMNSVQLALEVINRASKVKEQQIDKKSTEDNSAPAVPVAGGSVTKKFKGPPFCMYRIRLIP